MPDRHQHDTKATVGEEKRTGLGRLAGPDPGELGRNGAVARAGHGGPMAESGPRD